MLNAVFISSAVGSTRPTLLVDLPFRPFGAPFFAFAFDFIGALAEASSSLWSLALFCCAEVRFAVLLVDLSTNWLLPAGQSQTGICVTACFLVNACPRDISVNLMLPGSKDTLCLS